MEWNDGTINVRYVGISTGWGCTGYWKFEVADGNWADWSGWASCSKSCGTGSQQRTRTCTNPPPENGGNDCQGSSSQTQSCNTQGCPVNGGWTDYGSWTACTVTCGGGTRTKTRSCTNPSPQHNGADCSGSATMSESCNTAHCPIDGGFTTWTAWSTCTVSCAGGTQGRSRSCDNPPAQHGGADCSGDTQQSQSCNTHYCPINGGWTDYGSWTACTVTCGGGTRTKTRSCTNPSPQHNGADCSGSATMSESCNTAHCPIDGGFTTWTAWSTCTVSCAGGTQGRSRSCDNPPAQHGGADCSGDTQQSQNCNTHYCPIDGVWSDWGAWSSCGITCGTSTISRSRNCDNPTPQYNGSDCPGSDSETQSCSAAYGPCPIDGVFTTWTSWTTCTVTCAGGTQDRDRTCTNPSPAYGGVNCTGDYSQRQDCNTLHCPIDGGFTLWSDWADCSSTCGPGTATRTRTCTNPPAQYNGLPCSGSNSESTACNGTCIVDGGWGLWQSWTTCTATCNSGRQTRFRACDDPAPTPGGIPCLGNALEIQRCNEQACVSSGFSIGGGGSGGGSASGSYVNKCPAGFFTCRAGEITCIEEAFMCDCAGDCSDDSDELTDWASCEEECHDSATGVRVTLSAVIGSLLLFTVLTSF